MSAQAEARRMGVYNRDIENVTGVRLSLALRYGPKALEPLYLRARKEILGRATSTCTDLRRSMLLEQLTELRAFLARRMAQPGYLALLRKALYRVYCALKGEYTARNGRGLSLPTLATFFSVHGATPSVVQMQQEGIFSAERLPSAA